MEEISFTPDNSDHLKELISTKMPFGKYKGTPLYRLPEYYLVWFNRNGFPKGKLGELLGTMYEIKVNGLEYILKPLITKY